MSYDATSATFERVVADLGVPGAICGVDDGGRRDVLVAGVARDATASRVERSTRFRIGSITKLFTALTLAELLDDRALDMTSTIETLPVKTVLPSSSPVLNASPRHLLTHTSGLASHAHDEPGDDEGALTRFAASAGALPLASPTGLIHSYSNVGYAIAGSLIESLSDLSFEAAVNRCVIAPLGLSATAFEVSSDELDVAVGHASASGREHTPSDETYLPRHWNPSGGLFSSMDDLLDFGARIGDSSASIWHRLRQPIVNACGNVRWSLGAEVRNAGRHTLVLHTGSFGGQQSMLAVCPEQRFVYACLTNSDRGYDVAWPTLNAALDGRFGAGVNRLEPIGGDRSETVRYAGVYGNGFDSYRLTIDGGALLLSSARTDNALERVAPNLYQLIDDIGREPRFVDFFDLQAGSGQQARIGGRLMSRLTTE